MKLKAIKRFFVFLALLLALYPVNSVFAMQMSSANNSNIPKAYSLKIFEESERTLKMADTNTGIFHFAILDKNGVDITNIVPASSVSIKAFTGSNDFLSSFDRRRVKVDLDFQTGTATVSIESSDSAKILYIDFTYNNNPSLINFSPDDMLLAVSHLYINRPDDSNERAYIEFLSDYLTDIGNNTATFPYKVTYAGINITEKFPSSSIEANTSVGSSIHFDPKTGTGTIKFDSPVNVEVLRTTLQNKLNGNTVILNTVGLTKDPVKRQPPIELSKINFATGSLVKTSKDTATFNYRVLDRDNSNITRTVPAEDLHTAALIGTSKADISLDPSTGTGTIKYSFSDDDKRARITLAHKAGIETSAILNIVNTEAKEAENKDDNDLQAAQIVFIPTAIKSLTGDRVELDYRVYNQYGKDITKKIDNVTLVFGSNTNSGMWLYFDTVRRGELCVDYNTHDSDKTIIVSITDKATGVKASMNIGAAPKENSDSNTSTDSNKIIYFKDPVLEKAVRELLHMPTADITENDVKNITDISIGLGCEDLSGIENLKSLMGVQISQNKIKSLAPLKQLPTLRSLIYVAGSSNDIKTLSELTNLSLLQIKGTKISDEDLSLLRKSLTKCYVLQ